MFKFFYSFCLRNKRNIPIVNFVVSSSNLAQPFLKVAKTCP